MHSDAVPLQSRVLFVVDDLIATGGTVLSAIKLFNRLNAEIVGCSFLWIDQISLGRLEFLHKV